MFTVMFGGTYLRVNNLKLDFFHRDDICLKMSLILSLVLYVVVWLSFIYFTTFQQPVWNPVSSHLRDI